LLAGHHHHFDPQSAEPASQRAAVLFGEEFGGCHQGHLQPRGERIRGDQGRHRRFAGAHIPLEQTKHRPRAGQIVINFRHHSRLGAG
jgi:hypothetical protein